MSLSDPRSPSDPAYAPFFQGLKQFAADVAAHSNYFWHSGTSKWDFYLHRDWIFEDPRLGPTTDSSAFGQRELKPKDGKYVFAMRIDEAKIPGLLAKVQDAHRNAHAADPKANLVWHPAGGYWRSAIKRKTAGGSAPNLPPEALRRLEEVDEHVRADIIDHETGEMRKLQILAEYDRPGPKSG